MKNLLSIINNLLEDRCQKVSKEGRYKFDRRYYRSWSAFLGKIAVVNVENLLGVHHDTIVSKYLHTLPEMYRDLAHLYSYLNICTVTKDGVLQDPLWGRREQYSRKVNYYFFDEDGILCIKRKQRCKVKSPLTKAERMKKFYEDKKARNKRQREHIKQKEQVYQDMLQNIEYKRKEKEENINLQKIISHGFDPVTSFRNHG